MKEDKFLLALGVAIKDCTQKSLFDSPNIDLKLEEACVNYLRFRGYKVTKPKTYNTKIKNLDHLIEYFYANLDSKYPEYHSASFNISRDRATAKQFLEARMVSTGASKEHSLNECAEIIKTIFDHEEEFKFKYQISFSILGQSNLKWVTDKAISIMNRKIVSKMEDELEELQNRIINAQGTEDLGFKDLDSLLEKMED